MFKVFLIAFFVCGLFHLSTPIGLNPLGYFTEAIDCEACTTVISLTQSYIDNNATEQSIIQFLDKEVCSLIGGEIGAKCSESLPGFVADKFEAFITLDPSVLCSFIGLCSVSTDTIISMLNIDCDTCEGIVNKVDSFLADKEMQEDVVSLLNLGCTLLGGQYSNECENNVNTYFPKLMDLLVSELSNSQAVCNMFGVCAQSERPLLANITFNYPNQCVWCKTFFGQIEQIQDDDFEATITKTVDNLCNVQFPAVLSSTCSSFFTGLTSYVFDYWKSLINPDRICSKIKLC